MSFTESRSSLFSRRIGSVRAFSLSRKLAQLRTVPGFWEERFCLLVPMQISFGFFYQGMPKLLPLRRRQRRPHRLRTSLLLPASANSAIVKSRFLFRKTFFFSLALVACMSASVIGVCLCNGLLPRPSAAYDQGVDTRYIHCLNSWRESHRVMLSFWDVPNHCIDTAAAVSTVF
jgi:hypothetical protein